jgi:hypothetical protein
MERSEPLHIPLRPRSADCLVPLLGMQRYLYDRTRKELLSRARVGEASVRIRGPLNVPLLRQSVDMVVQRHESLRTRIVVVDGIPRQQIDAPGEFDLEIIDVLERRPLDAEEQVKRFTEEFIGEGIDLAVGPLFAVRLLKLAEDDYLLLLGIDHIVTDGASCAIISYEIWTLYSQTARGLPFSLAQVPIQLADYAIWQERTYEAWRAKHESYWTARLTDAPQLELPFDANMCVATNRTWEMVDFSFGEAPSASLRDIAWKERTLLPLVVLTVVVAVMSRWCSQRDFVVACVSHGRHGPKLAQTTGFLAYSLPLRIELADGDTFLDLLKRVALEFSGACQHLDCHRVSAWVPGSSSLQFNWATTSWSERSIRQAGAPGREVAIQRFPIVRTRIRREVPAAARLLQLIVRADRCSSSDGIRMDVWYGTDAFLRTTIERLLRNLRRFTAEFVSRPDAAVPVVIFE